MPHAYDAGPLARSDSIPVAQMVARPLVQSTTPALSALPEIEPELLAVLFSACTAKSLARLETALGAKLGRAVCATMQYRWAWVRGFACLAWSVRRPLGGLAQADHTRMVG